MAYIVPLSRAFRIMAPFGKILILTGLVIAGVGVIVLFADRIPFLGKLPGDIAVKKENFQLYVPLTTGIVLSIVVSLVLWLLSLIGKK